MTYQLTTGVSILRLEDGAFIPPDPDNTDYAAFLAWTKAGNAPLPPPAGPRPMAPLSLEEKLAAIGLTLDELKEVLR